MANEINSAMLETVELTDNRFDVPQNLAGFNVTNKTLENCIYKYFESKGLNPRDNDDPIWVSARRNKRYRFNAPKNDCDPVSILIRVRTKVKGNRQNRNDGSRNPVINHIMRHMSDDGAAQIELIGREDLNKAVAALSPNPNKVRWTILRDDKGWVQCELDFNKVLEYGLKIDAMKRKPVVNIAYITEPKNHKKGPVPFTMFVSKRYPNEVYRQKNENPFNR